MTGSDTFPIIAVGASAGGLEALTVMFSELAPETQAAFVVIQHLDPDHDSVMAEILGRKTGLAVHQAIDDEVVLPGTIYLIPPGKGLRIHNGRLFLASFAEPRGARRPIDDFFLSLAEDGHNRFAAVVLSGTGADGSYGIRSVKETGGIVVVQRPEESKYDGMPLSAVATGLVDYVLPASEIVPHILNHFSHEVSSQPHKMTEELITFLPEVCALLRSRMGHDFSGYKHPTLLRRIERRMQVLGVSEPNAYMLLLRTSSEECQRLFNDFLINVTRFFRDPANFEVLSRRAIDPMIASCGPGDVVRIWVPACSTGEEAYSIAMTCMYACERYGVQPNLQIFATDIDGEALDVARLARYHIDALQDIPEEMRGRFTLVQGKEFQIVPRVRDVIRFSSHNLVRDPAFSRMDLISCRNLFIYFNDKTQKSVVPLLHFSLKNSGYLFLGPSESIGESEHLFSSIDRQARLYRKRDVPAAYPMEFVASGVPSRPTQLIVGREAAPVVVSPPADPSVRRILDQYAPATVTISDRGEIVGSTGRLARYFEFNGRGQESALSSARPGLREVLGPLLRKAEVERTRILHKNVEVVSEFGIQTADIIADPLSDGYILLIFRESEEFDLAIQEVDEVALRGDARQHQLEEELQQLRMRLRVTIEELETANEELKSSNEEMMSMNEELQSTNEELTTANDELKHKIDQLDVLNTDQRNFFVSTDLAVVILDAQMRVRAFTPRVRELFPLRDSDKGRLLEEISTTLEDDGLLLNAQDVLVSGVRQERLVRGAGRSYQMRVMPYISSGGRVDGVTLTFADVTELHDLQAWLAKERNNLVMALHTGNTGIFDVNRETGRITVDEQMSKLLQLDDSHRRDLTFDEFCSYLVEEDQEKIRNIFNSFEANGQIKFDVTVRSIIGGGNRYLRLLGGDVTEDTNGLRLIGLCQDATQQREQDNSQRLLIEEMNHRIKNLFAVIGSLIRLSEKDAIDVKTFSASARSRISALSRAHAASQGGMLGHAANLRRLIEVALEPYNMNQITLNGPMIDLYETKANPLSLILHEWATNAAKYGALANDGGRVTISWALLGDDQVNLVWSERLAEPLSGDIEVKRVGFGSQLVHIAARQLHGNAKGTLAHEGYMAELTFTLSDSRNV